MKPTFKGLNERQKARLDAYLDETITSKEFDAMQDDLAADPAYREVARRYLALDDALANPPAQESASSEKKITPFPQIIPLAAAAGLAFLLGSGLMFWWQKDSSKTPEISQNQDSKTPPSARGFAVIENLFDATWPENAHIHQTGDLLGDESFHLASGRAEIQFFSGALMTIEGPAQISLKSAWEARCHEGAVRMKVPPAARGFKLQSPSSEIIDLGTEFGLVVKNGAGKVEVFDGEIAIRHPGEEEKLVKKGAALALVANRPLTKITAGQADFPNSGGFTPQVARQRLASFESWQKHRDTLAQNQDLLAYYTFEQKTPGSLIPNLALPKNRDLDGAVILAESVQGRWPGLKSAFEFRRPGSRIRVNLPGEFPALTFACWVRIDSLDRRYNALFMGDGYENGEPHWQLRDDGKLMLSIMVDENSRHPLYPESRFHHVYFSPKIWDLSMSGQWLHLASVYDSSSSLVTHFVDGEKISQEPIEGQFLVKTLRIGNGEIGNWGQPFRKDPNFTIRNLNGRMDELAIFKTALSEAEIKSLFQKSRSTHRK